MFKWDKSLLEQLVGWDVGQSPNIGSQSISWTGLEMRGRPVPSLLLKCGTDAHIKMQDFMSCSCVQSEWIKCTTVLIVTMDTETRKLVLLLSKKFCY